MTQTAVFLGIGYCGNQLFILVANKQRTHCLTVFTEVISNMAVPLHLLAQVLLRKVAHINEVYLDMLKG